MKVECVLFDLDGTLLNTNDLVLESLKYTIKAHLREDKEDSELYKYFGQPLVNIMADLDSAKADEMVLTYREYSARKHDTLTKVFPEVPETLRVLKQQGIPTAVVTSKLKSLALRGLKLFDLQTLFNTCVAFEDTDSHKPEPDPILKALEVLDLKAARKNILMVGDSPYDILCAGNAGVASAAVMWSLHPTEVLTACHPDIWLKEFSGLLEYI